ncbi:Iron dependent repressor, metal binding and dimerization domain [Nocardioides dokdonensis FR1436]|uniref:Iron dependent repressor, metal binding and dimerization domain n=1 Tax=Nocardioides dokdonensis FR1436 TaxID=1300347 RepID=A0A1A9GJT4_9ACTN|nr:iron dependent repressor, metal binding and dimerization domain protein [Nocardioides dokdonensis]ANH38528.1 Iron dependent repressor, metal binding and dimerization domain [Nocardioides dokdonensis FR1436]
MTRTSIHVQVPLPSEDERRGNGQDHEDPAGTRRRLLVETFLHRVLGLTCEEIPEEVTMLERNLSHGVEELIDAALGFPRHDHHGRAIPAAPMGSEPIGSARAGRGGCAAAVES